MRTTTSRKTSPGEEEVIEPARRVMKSEKSLDDGEIEPPWIVADSAPWGGWASGAFYPAFQTILIDDVELVEIKMVAEGEGSQSANPTETAISLDELKSLRGDR